MYHETLHSLFLRKPDFTFDAIIRQQYLSIPTSLYNHNIFSLPIHVVLLKVKLPVIAENCPACFEAPKVSAVLIF